MVKIKVCGVTRVEDAAAAAAAGADAIGLNFAPESPRYIGSAQQARQLISSSEAGPQLQWAGVFVNLAAKDLAAIADQAGLQIVQLHGEEPPEYLTELRKLLRPEIALWKVFRVAGEDDVRLAGTYGSDAWVFDTKSKQARGGVGQVFDWSLLKQLTRTVPLVLAGGLNPENVAEAVREVGPDWVDVASGIESAPGRKDALKLARFFEAARNR